MSNPTIIIKSSNFEYAKRDSPHAFKEVTFFYGALASPDHVQPYYPNRVVRQFNREQGIPIKRLLTEVSNLWNAKEPRIFNPKYEWVDCFSSQKWKEFVLKKVNRGQRVREGPLVYDDVGIHRRKPASVNEHGDTPMHQSKNIVEQYDALHHEYASLSPNINLNDQQIIILNDQLQKLKEDKEKEFEANLNLRDALKEKTSECDLLKETIEQMKVEIELKHVVGEQYIGVQKFGGKKYKLGGRAKCKEIKLLKVVNTILTEQIDIQLPPTTPLDVLQSHQPVPDITQAKNYEDLLAAHEDVKKKLIAK
ncbi:hypothetical protein GIB67_036435 [Kingdonia uniflora]|uniref:Uncharacterized protein n=1 Tax=Kingdonia uniflora TaxID=39325 RepID=A0A7J7L4C1_9MAGN|nr:hypothetical protein GIB67_036435 [Kingdonia uniflora]